MAIELPGFSITLTAGQDLSSAQFRFVKLSADNTVVQCTATTDNPIGVLQNKPGSLGAAEVMTMGLTKLVAGGSLGYGVMVGTDAAGKGTAVVSGASGTVAYPKGQVVIGNTAANGIVTVLLGVPTQRAF
jgi:hypothetical protein